MTDIAVQTRTGVLLKIATSASIAFKIVAVAFTTSQVLAFGLAFFIWRART